MGPGGYMLSDKEVAGVATQGRHNINQWVSEYKIEYKEDGVDQFKTILDENGEVLGNCVSLC